MFVGGQVLLFLVERTPIVHALWGTVAILATSGVAGFLAVPLPGLIRAVASLVLLIQRVRGRADVTDRQWDGCSGDGPGVSDTVGRLLSALGVVCALVGVFVMGGISIQFPSILLGAAGQAADEAVDEAVDEAAGQASGLSGRDRTGGSRCSGS